MGDKNSFNYFEETCNMQVWTKVHIPHKRLAIYFPCFTLGVEHVGIVIIGVFQGTVKNSLR